MCNPEYCERLRYKQETIMNLDRDLAAATTTIAELKTEIAYQNKQIAQLQEDLSKKTRRGNDV